MRRIKVKIKILNDKNAELFEEDNKIATLKLKKINNRVCITKIYIKENYKEIYTKIDIANIIFSLTNNIDILFKEKNNNI